MHQRQEEFKKQLQLKIRELEANILTLERGKQAEPTILARMFPLRS
jgi:hypothetical protein